MALGHAGKPVCTQSQYWSQFVINIVAVLGLLALAVYALFSGSWGVALLAFLAIAPVGVWFRVVMMRRCRDIGWPTFLPWLFFIGTALLNAAQIGNGMNAMRQGLAGGPSLAPMMIGLLDFGFMVVLGCIPGRKREDFAGVFDDGVPLRAAQPAYRTGYGEPAPRAAPRAGVPEAETEQEARWDAAIARALAARESPHGEPVAAHQRTPDAAPAAGRPAAPGLGAGRPGGFGRRVI